MVYPITSGIPIRAIISIVNRVLSVDEALYMVRLFVRSVREGTSLGNRLAAINPIIQAIVNDEAKNALPGFSDFNPTGIYMIAASIGMNKIQNSGLLSIDSKRYPDSNIEYIVTIT